VSLILQSNRILVTDGATTVFDTDRRQLHWVDFKAGSYTLPARTATTSTINPNSNVNVDTEYNIGSVPTVASIVKGMVRTNYSVSNAFVNSLWRTVGGSIIDTALTIPGRSAVTFRVSGGVLYLRENVVITPTGGQSNSSVTIPSRTIEYRLYIGAFDQ
jgi:hypothetical protein